MHTIICFLISRFFYVKRIFSFIILPFFFSFRIEVQCGHLVASMSISLLQNGHTFVVGAGSSSFFAPMEVILFTAFRRQKRINAMITPIAMSMTFPRNAKALNSSRNFFICDSSLFFRKSSDSYLFWIFRCFSGKL